MKTKTLEKIVTISAVGFLTIGPTAVAWYRMPESPPKVNRLGDRIEIEPHTYSGAYLTRHSDGRTTVMLVDGFFYADGPYRYYTANSKGVVTKIEGDLRDYELESDFASHPDIFAKAQRDFNRIVDRYQPQLVRAEQQSQAEQGALAETSF